MVSSLSALPLHIPFSAGVPAGRGKKKKKNFLLSGPCTPVVYSIKY